MIRHFATLVNPSRFLCLAALCFVFTSCEDKALAKENEELRVKVIELEKSITLLEVEAGEDPGDQTKNLDKANEQLSAVLANLEKLEKEKEDVEAEQLKLEARLRAYQKKYKIKQ